VRRKAIVITVVHIHIDLPSTPTPEYRTRHRRTRPDPAPDFSSPLPVYRKKRRTKKNGPATPEGSPDPASFLFGFFLSRERFLFCRFSMFRERATGRQSEGPHGVERAAEGGEILRSWGRSDVPLFNNLRIPFSPSSALLVPDGLWSTADSLCSKGMRPERCEPKERLLTR